MAGNPFISLVSAKTGLSPAVLNAWVRAEGGPAGNPLNIGPGRNYGSPQAAANATAQLLLGSHYYRGILAARGNPAATIAAIKASPWDAAHYSNGVLDRTAAAFGIGRYPSGALSPSAAGGTRAVSPSPPAAVSAGLDPRLAAVLDLNNQIQGLGLPPMATLAGGLRTAAPAMQPSQGAMQTFRLGAAGGFLPAGAHYAPGRKDQGHDFQTSPGGAIIAPGAGKVVSVKSDPHGFGPAYPVVYFTSGPYRGHYIYIGHTLSALRPGASFRPGQVISRTGTTPLGNASVPGWAEIGYAPGGTPGSFGQPTPF